MLLTPFSSQATHQTATQSSIAIDWKLEKRPTKNLSELRQRQVQSIWTNLSDDYL